MYVLLHCQHCKELVGDDDIYCSICGAKLDKVVRCPKCTKPMIEKTFCYECLDCGVLYSKR